MTARRRTIFAIFLAATVAAAGFLAIRLDVHADIGFFLPKSPTPASRLVAEGLQRGPAAGLILMAIGGGDAAARERASDDLTSRLRAGGRFALIANGRPRPDRKMLDALTRYRYVLNPPLDPKSLDAASLRHRLAEALAALGTTVGAATARLLPSDPTARVRDIGAAWAARAGPRRQGGIWVSRSGDRALLVASPRRPALDSPEQKAAITEVRAAFAATAPGLRLHLTGPSVFAAEARDRIRREAILLSGLATVLVALLLFAAFRSSLLLLAFALPIAGGILAGAAAVQAMDGHVHGITLAFGATLIGIAIDYPLHLAAHSAWQSTSEGAIERIWPTLRLGAVTTISAFMPLTLSSFPGLSQLGVFTLTGLAVAAATTRWLLPELLPRQSPPIRWAGRLGRPPRRGTMQTLRIGGGVAAFIAAVYLVFGADSAWENDLRNINPVPRDRLIADGELRGQLGAPDVRRLIVVSGATAEAVLRQSEDLAPGLDLLARDGALTGFDMAALLMPSMRTQKTRAAALPAPAALAAALGRASAGLPFRDGMFQPFLRDLERTRSGPPTPFERVAGSAIGWRVAPLLYRTGSGWAGLVQLSGVAQPQRIAEWIAGHGDGNLAYLDLKAESDRLVTGYRREALRWLAIGAVAALLMLISGLRDAMSVAQILTPLVLALIVTAGVLLASGAALSILHLLGLLLVAGLGLDYGLFFNRRFASPSEAEHTAAAVLLCAATTVTVFAILAFSGLSVLNSIGRTVAIGAMLAVAFGYGFRRLPSSD